jgi:2-methylisocitrate lyase-like PEP mutase family enzyme
MSPVLYRACLKGPLMNSQNPTCAEIFHRLHRDGILVLANAWDAGSARVIESAGAQALATTSAGVAWAHGYADGDKLPLRLLVQTVCSITRVTRVPLSVDFEGGYSDDPKTVGEGVASLIDAGAVGLNIEDGAGEVDLLCRKIEAARSAGERLGVKLFINARTDIYLKRLVAAEQRVEETIRRAARYREAGASGIFPAGVSDADEIRTLATEIDLPLNVLAWAGLPSASALAQLGVRRLSAGSSISESAYGHAAQLARAFIDSGDPGSVLGGALDYSALQALVTR